MKKIFTTLFILSLLVSPSVSNAGFFDFLRINQTAQVKNVSTINSNIVGYRKGDRADVITQVQKALFDKGLYKGDISGLIGPKTEASIRAWQQANRLSVTGILDAETINSILGSSRDDNRGGGNPNSTTAQANCAPGDMPWIKVKNPNGGEIYVPGENVKVQWESCNIPIGTPITIHQYYQDPNTNGDHYTNITTASAGGTTNNDGIEQVTLRDAAIMSANNEQYGQNFKIMVKAGTAMTEIASDESDTKFFVLNQLGGGGNCVEANALSSYLRTINAGLGEQVVAKYAIENNCPNEVSIDKLTLSLVAFKGQDLIVQADLFENVAGVLTPISGTYNFTHTVTPSGEENIRTFVLSTDSNGVSIVTLPAGDSTIIEMHAKTQSQIPSVYDNPTVFVIGLSDLDYYDLVLEQSGNWTQTSPVWGERTIINAQ